MFHFLGISIGLFAGLVTGFSGASGVMVVIPLVTLFLGLPIHQAIGTSLLADVLISAPVAWSYWRYGDVQLRQIIFLLVGALVGAQLGAHEAGSIPGGFLTFALSGFLVIMGIIMFYRGLPRARMNALSKITVAIPKFFSHAIGLSIVGFLLGLLTGFFGAGGGLLAFLVLFFVLRFPLRSAIGTSTAFMLFTALSGTLGYVGEGSIAIRLGIFIGIGGIVGGVMASYLAHHIPESMLSRVIGALFFMLGVALLILRVVGA